MFLGGKAAGKGPTAHLSDSLSGSPSPNLSYTGQGARPGAEHHGGSLQEAVGT